MSDDLTAIVDRCLDDLAAGRATVADCLARYPQHRAALEPLLAAAAAMRRVPRPAERTPDPARRAALMAQLRSTPQQRPHSRWHLPSPAWPALRGGFLPHLVAAAAPVAFAIAIGVVLLVGQRATPAAASTLTLFGGGVEQQVDGGWRPLTDGAQLAAGAHLRTAADGHALITFPDGSTTSLDPDTEIAIDALAASGPRVVRLHQFSGRLWNDVVTDLRAGAAYEVRTADASVQVHGTVFETAIGGGQTAVSTAEGTVDVIAGTERISVPRGEQLRARAQKIDERTAIPPGGSLTVAAPFAAALLAPGGEATGARADGAIFRQIRGVTTSNPAEGPQRFDFQRLEPGVYTLLLHRLGGGTGDLVLDAGDGEHRISLDDQTGTVRVQVRVVLNNGVPGIELLGSAPERIPATPDPVRVVETERTRKAQDLATAQRERNDREQARATPPPTRLIDPVVEAFARSLHDALSRNDPAAIRDRLGDIVAPADAPTVQARLAVLAALVAENESMNRVTRALATEANAALRTRLLQASETLAPPEARARLRRALLGEPARAPTNAPTRSPATPSPATTQATTTLDPALAAFMSALRAALARNDPAAIRERLSDILVPGDAQTVRARMEVLAFLVGDDESTNRVTRALATDANAALRTRLLQAVETTAAPGVRPRLRRALLGEPIRVPTFTPRPEPPRTPTPTLTEPPRTPTPTRTEPVRTPTPTPTPTGTR